MSQETMDYLVQEQRAYTNSIFADRDISPDDIVWKTVATIQAEDDPRATEKFRVAITKLENSGETVGYVRLIPAGNSKKIVAHHPATEHIYYFEDRK